MKCKNCEYRRIDTGNSSVCCKTGHKILNLQHECPPPLPELKPYRKIKSIF